jgi:hypothetical protein
VRNPKYYAMKNSIFALIVILSPFFLNFRFAHTPPTTAELDQQMSGKWEVSYVMAQTLHTRELAAYTFDFQAGGQLLVDLPNQQQAHGTWQVNATSQKLEIHLGGNNALRHLENDWLVSEIKGNQEIMIQWKKP